MTDILSSDLVVQSLYSTDGYIRASDIIVQTLRSTGTGGETFVAADDIIVQTLYSPAAGLVLSDSLASSDSFSPLLGITVSLTDDIIASGDFSTTGERRDTLIDSIDSTDIFSPATFTVTETLSDTVVASEALNGVPEILPTDLDDTINSSDNFTLNFFATLSDSVADGDAWQSQPGFSFTISDVVRTSDEIEYPRITVDGLRRNVLGAYDPNLAVAGLARKALASGAPRISIVSVVRKALVALQIPVVEPVPDLPFPELPYGFPVKVTIVWDTTIGTTKSLREMRVAQQQFPLWDIELVFPELRDQTQNIDLDQRMLGYTQYQRIVQLWLSMYGQTGVFKFDAPWDNSRKDQYIATGDGVSWHFPIFHTWGRGAQATLLQIGMINTVYAVYFNGVEVPASDYYIIRDTIYFNNPTCTNPRPPPNGTIVTMTFSFYYLCRFVEDEQDFEEFSKDRWTVPALKFRAIYWPTVFTTGP